MENIVNESMVKEQSIKETINLTLSAIKEINGKIKKMKNDLKDKLMANADYKTAIDESKEANTLVKTARAGVMKSNQDAYKLSDELKSLRADLKLNKESLSEYLLTYEKQSGQDHIENEDGIFIKINKVASIQLKLI
jgi:hypothetical protein